jgi:hypothetical protein
MSDHPLASTEAVKSLAERLTQIAQIAKLSDEEHDEAWALAHSLSDIAEASEAYLRSLPALVDPGLEGDALLREVLELTSHLQHMLYHLEDPRFLANLFAPLRHEWAEQRSGSQ